MTALGSSDKAVTMMTKSIVGGLIRSSDASRCVGSARVGIASFFRFDFLQESTDNLAGDARVKMRSVMVPILIFQRSFRSSGTRTKR
jgi:hypothetical protein